MYKVVYIGNRVNVFKALISHPELKVIKAFVIEQPLISGEYDDEPWMERISAKKDLNTIVEYLNNNEFDICVSGGCSYILPVDDFPKKPVYLNCHPSVLPWGKGIHPLNECFIGGREETGVSIHYLTSGLDCGDLIEQKIIKLTPEVDVSLLYGVLFELEAELLTKTIDRLIKNDFCYLGVKQKGEGSYYSRPMKLDAVEPSVTRVNEFNNMVRAFSSSNLGQPVRTEYGLIRAFSSREIINDFFIERYEKLPLGSVCMKGDGFLVVKFKDGLVYINKLAWV